jgi:tetratricopeptide (TPR) repeat protein
MADVKKVMISSTARDLPEHRRAVEVACERQGMFTVKMEDLPAMDADAIEASLGMVEDADFYVGVFAHRYGYVPDGHDISVTEMEYNRAVELGKPLLIFFMHEDHPVKASDVETGPGAEKLKAFKNRVGKDRVAGFFKSVDDLRGLVIDTLSRFRVRTPAAESFHYISAIPRPPEVYVAHPYTLLQTKDLIGRQNELDLLTDWVAKPSSDVYNARILNIVALGGMGKSALTWKWFNDIAPQEMKPLAGRMWWSFYESDATFENFIIRALAYVSGRPREEVAKLPAHDREDALLAALSTSPFLLVLDGLERILLAYSGMDAARRLDDDELDKQTANRVSGASGLPAEAAESFVGQHRLRQCIDVRVGIFLRKLAGVQASRILVTTRLYPSELQLPTGHPGPGCFAYFVTGLSDDDALNLWRAYGVSGSREELLRLFHTFGNYPLLIRALAGEVAGYRRAPGDFDKWRAANRDFDPYSRLSLVSARTHVLEYAMRNLTEAEHKVLHTVAALRMPASYDTLAALLIGNGKKRSKKRPCVKESQLDTVLASLEDRGLVGWDRRANRYDLHPVVRGVTLTALTDGEKAILYKTLHGYFEAMPPIDVDNAETFEDLTPVVELFNTLIALGRFEDAYTIFAHRLDHATHHRLRVSSRRVELLETFFADGLDAVPRLLESRQQSWVINALALAYQSYGAPEHSILFFRRAVEIDRNSHNCQDLPAGLCNTSYAMSLAGIIYAAEAAACEGLDIARRNRNQFDEHMALLYLGAILGSRGRLAMALTVIQRAIDNFRSTGQRQVEGVAMALKAECSLWQDDFATALTCVDEAWCAVQECPAESEFIRVARLRGITAIAIRDAALADERLCHALTRARAVSLVEEELPALTALAELRRRQGNLPAARDLLDDVWDLAERGPYPLLHADARNVLAKIERDAGNHDLAIAAATRAYQLAWCDGPPYAYHWGLEAARALLTKLGAPEPECTPFDPSKYPPMPEVEIEFTT